MFGCPLLGVVFKSLFEGQLVEVQPRKPQKFVVLQMTVLTVYVFLYGKVYLVCEQ